MKMVDILKFTFNVWCPMYFCEHCYGTVYYLWFVTQDLSICLTNIDKKGGGEILNFLTILEGGVTFPPYQIFAEGVLSLPPPSHYPSKSMYHFYNSELDIDNDPLVWDK